MKKILQKPWFWLAVLAVIISVSLGGYYYINGVKNLKSSTEDESIQNKPATEKDYTPSVEKSKNPDEGKSTPAIPESTNNLDGVTLTVYLIDQEMTSADGKTQIPAGALQPYFYPNGSGLYSIQKQEGLVWIDVVSSYNYPGHGGIAGGNTNSTEDNVNYRLVKIENSRVVGVSKIFTLKRSNLSSGFYTYN